MDNPADTLVEADEDILTYTVSAWTIPAPPLPPLDQAEEEEILTHTVSDEAIEAAVGTERGVYPPYTLSRELTHLAPVEFPVLT
jgi:hypothetical protein